MAEQGWCWYGTGVPFRPLHGLSFFNCLLSDIRVCQTLQLTRQTGGSLFKWIHSKLASAELDAKQSCEQLQRDGEFRKMFKSTGYWFSLSILKMNQCRTWREAVVCSIQVRVAMRRDVATVALTLVP